LTVVVLLAAVGLLIGGAVELAGALVKSHRHRFVRGLLGVVGIGAGLLVLEWPRPTLGVLASLGGVALVAIGALEFLFARKASADIGQLAAT
jgi:uncharacterized membrane protein HdeD (DUF308 family)